MTTAKRQFTKDDPAEAFGPRRGGAGPRDPAGGGGIGWRTTPCFVLTHPVGA